MILLYNPRSCDAKYRMPISLLALAGTIEKRYDYEIIDGNLLDDPYPVLEEKIERQGIGIVGMTVMPGPQLVQAIGLARRLKERFPGVTMIWGGYFPSNHTEVTIRAPFVDYVINGQGDVAFPLLIDALHGRFPLDDVPNLVYMKGDAVVAAPQAPLLHPDQMPPLPYQSVDVARYYNRTYLGSRTLNYHSSVGCPFECSFCAIVPIYKARWLGKSAGPMADDIEKMIADYGANAIEFHDNNFFTSEKRVVEFSEEVLRRGLKFSWWGEGRPDQLLRYSEESFALMKRAGLKMAFMGAESGDDATLAAMNKGGTQTGNTIVEVVRKFQRHDIVPECSFVLGTPSDDVQGAIDRDIAFIRKLKEINPATEIIIYVYSPIPMDGASLYESVTQSGFRYPRTLEEWCSPEWARFDLRRNPLTPWLKPEYIERIRNFERVLNSKFPTNSDIKLKPYHTAIMKALGSWRYKLQLYDRPYELQLVQRLFRYRQPEIQGF